MTDVNPDQDLDFDTLPPYLDVMVTDDEGALRILGAGDTPEQAMQAMREHLADGSMVIPVRALYHSYAMVRSLDSARMRTLISEDPTAHAFYVLGRQDERVITQREIRELGDERMRRASLEQTLTDTWQILEDGNDDNSAPANRTIDVAQSRISEVMPTLTRDNESQGKTLDADEPVTPSA